MPLVIGAHLGPYEIIAPLGSGGMGEVYRARDSRLGRDVAIKVSAERFSDRFAREARAVAALNHPNICTLHDIGPDYLVMELVDGITLEEHLRQSFGPNPSGSSEASATGHKSAPLSVEEALRLAYQIADALEAAHARGVVHRDLKPANVKLRPDGTVKVLDFGLATLDAGGVGAEGADLSRSPTMMASMP